MGEKQDEGQREGGEVEPVEEANSEKVHSGTRDGATGGVEEEEGGEGEEQQEEEEGEEGDGKEEECGERGARAAEGIRTNARTRPMRNGSTTTITDMNGSLPA